MPPQQKKKLFTMQFAFFVATETIERYAAQNLRQ